MIWGFIYFKFYSKIKSLRVYVSKFSTSISQLVEVVLQSNYWFQQDFEPYVIRIIPRPTHYEKVKIIRIILCILLSYKCQGRS